MTKFERVHDEAGVEVWVGVYGPFVDQVLVVDPGNEDLMYEDNSFTPDGTPCKVMDLFVFTNAYGAHSPLVTQVLACL